MTRVLKLSDLSLFYIAVVLHGLQRISGLFVIELSKSRSLIYKDAVVPFIYSWAVSKIVASFSDFLIDNKSSDITVFCGVLLCTMGTTLCILDTDIWTITVFWGFIFGSGYGLVSSHLTKILKNVDSNKLLIFAELSSSIGITIMPFALNSLIQQYGLQGSYIIFSGLILQYMPLALAAAYKIEIRIPNIKWGIPKKSSRYSVTNKEDKTVFNGSFVNSLEPDLSLKINSNDIFQYEINGDNSIILPKEIISVGRKRSGTRSHDLPDLEMNRKMYKKHRIQSQVTSGLKNCEKNQLSEESHNNMNVDVKIQCKGFNQNSYADTFHTSGKNALNSGIHDFTYKNKVLENISEIVKRETEENKLHLEENNAINNLKILAPISEDGGTYPITDGENSENKQRISLLPKQAENTFLSTQISNSEKLFNKEALVLSPHSFQTSPLFTIPVDIKVYIEECTITEDDENMNNFCSTSSEEENDDKKSSPKSEQIIKTNEIINSESQNFSGCSLQILDSKTNLGNVYPFTNNSRFDRRENASKNNKQTRDVNTSKNKLKQKCMGSLHFFNKIISPVYLCIVVITIIFETSLITLLLQIGDCENETERISSDFRWILVAFGIGGLCGKLCCSKISRSISEKPHTIGLILFLLMGLSVAGVLYSPNMNWLAVFYGIVGALEGGISYVMQKFILNHTQKEMHHMISWMKNLFSGVAIICLPHILGLLPDEMGDYEFLLQTFSCLSILCAFIAYFMPYLRSTNDEGISISHKKKMSKI